MANSKLDTFAKILLIIGALFGIHPFAIAISAPLYITGLFLIWKSKHLKQKSKLYWTTIPLVSILVIWSLLITISWILGIK